MTNRITDPLKIRATLDAYVREPSKQRAPYLVAIFSRQHHPGGVVYEGCRPIAASQSDEDRTYTLSNMDSDYQLGTAWLELSQIEYIETLR